MVQRLRLFDVFGDFRAAWPSAWLQADIGLSPNEPNPSAWLAGLNNGATLGEVRTGARGGRFSVEAKLAIDTLATGFGDHYPFVILAMPDVEFRIQSVPMAKAARLFAGLGADGVEIVLEGLPVEIRLPAGMLRPHPDDAGALDASGSLAVGAFSAGSPDTQRIVYAESGPSSVFVHIRLHIRPDRSIEVVPAVPIGFGKCRFLDVPCLAVHGFQLIPSPRIGHETNEWIRHDVTPWPGMAPDPVGGMFAVRSVHLDPAQDPTKAVADRLGTNAEREPNAEFVFDDLVVPFYSTYVLPVPRHITMGIRRPLASPKDKGAAFDFDRPPARITINRDPPAGINIEKLFVRSLSAEEIQETLDIGVTFSALVFFGKNKDGTPRHGIVVELGENLTPRIGYRRNFDVATGLPEGQDNLNPLHFEILGAVKVDIIGFRAGYSIGRAVGEGLGFGDCFELLFDLYVSMPPTGGDESFFRLRALNGEKVAVALEGVGWRQGGLSLEGLKLPDGVVVVFGPVGIVLQEIGVAAEDGASYLSLTAGLMVKPPGGFEGGALAKRLRFRIAGNAEAPSWKLDGVFAFFRAPSFSVEVGGYFTDETVGGMRRREFGLTGTVEFDASAVRYRLSLDLILGRITGGGDDYAYNMFQAVLNGSIPVYTVELRGLRLLWAINMLPKLSAFDAESLDFRYFNWYRATDPLKVSGDRRLAAWRPQNEAFALGIGCGIGIVGLGAIAQLRGFVMLVWSDPEKGLLITADLLLGISNESIAYAAIELDLENGRWGLVAGVELSPRKLLKQVPEFLDRIAKITGTVIAGSKPNTFAIGRLKDQKTWLGLRVDVDIFVVRSHLLMAFCLEIVEGGPVGTGFVLRVEGGVDYGVVRIEYVAGLGWLIANFNTGSADFAAIFFIEAGIRAVLFGFLRFGLSIRAELRLVGANPSRNELSVTIRFETPWFLPDITFKLQHSWGEVVPAALGVGVGPLGMASAALEYRPDTAPVHVERFDRDWDGIGQSPTYSVDQLRAGTGDEAARLARFLANAAVGPVATDARVAVEFTIPVNDKLGYGGAVSGMGDQASGDLTLTYDLVGLRIRRRPRFGPAQPWTTVDERIEFAADFSDPNGVQLSGSFGPQRITAAWAPDIRIAGQTATKKLLVNSTTPFEFATRNPEADEEVVGENPNWPCCDRRPPPGGRTARHQVIFRDDLPGTDASGHRLFTESISRFRLHRAALARPRLLGASLPPGAVVAAVVDLRPGLLFSAELDRDAAGCQLRLAWQVYHRRMLTLAAYDAFGRPVGRTTQALNGSSDFVTLRVAGQGPIRRLEARLAGPRETPEEQPSMGLRGAVVELDLVGYVALAERLDELVQGEACKAQGESFANAYEGRGKVFFLPNHEYEIEVTTRITAAHPSVDPAATELREYAYFATKGLPGLNAQGRVGEEVEPYVACAYDGGRGHLYREEPITLAFNEGFHVAVPLARRPAGTTQEHVQLLRMALTVRPETAAEVGTPYTGTAVDWIVDNRKVVFLDPPHVWTRLAADATTVASAMVSSHPAVERLAVLTQREAATCPLDDPRETVGPVLVARPQGSADPLDPTKQLWSASARLVATARPEGTTAVDRPRFEPADLTAFDYALDGGAGGGGAWQVRDGAVTVTGQAERHFALFGEADWNHANTRVAVSVAQGMAGLGFALPAAGAGSGLFAVLERTGAGRRLALYRRAAPGEFTLLASAPLPDAAPEVVSLGVDAFDDLLRLAAGEAVAEAPRLAQREGRMCLIARGTVAFHSLQVDGLAIHQFPCQVSRYRDFSDHIGSFAGAAATIGPDSLGPGTTTRTVAQLWTETGAAVAAAMAPDAAPTSRQELFTAWLARLGLAVRQEVTRLELTRYMEAAETAALLLESPEPIDFTEEVVPTLSRRVRRGGRPPVFDADRFRDLIDAVLGPVVPRRPPVPLPGPPAGATRPGPSLPRVSRAEALPRPIQPIGSLVREVDRRGDRLRLDLDPGLRPDMLPLATAEGLIVLAVGEPAAEGRVPIEVMGGKIERKPGRRLAVTAVKQREVLARDSARGTLEAGTVVLLDPATHRVIDVMIPWFTYVDVPVHVIQDAEARRALVLPMAGDATARLPAGTYRLRLALSRKRWPTTDPADALNTYADAATLVLQA